MWISLYAKSVPVNARVTRYRQLVEVMYALHARSYDMYGIRNMWYALRRAGIVVGREQTGRLMRLAGLSDKGKGRFPIATCRGKCEGTRLDLVYRVFRATKPGRLCGLLISPM
ncbi:IS3 family transposase [Arcanobacterium phocae]|uniref:IS3 family transposase n=2 Tax=Arcanobacterium phocae TaxID=131112 RepID=UPI001C0EB1B5|nr:IS3 family transposase [Arcanobacterium phocae]